MKIGSIVTLKCSGFTYAVTITHISPDGIYGDYDFKTEIRRANGFFPFNQISLIILDKI